MNRTDSIGASEPSDRDTLRIAERLVTDALPPRWSLHSPAKIGSTRLAAAWSVTAPDGAHITYGVALKRSASSEQIASIRSQLERTAPDAHLLVAAPFLGRGLRAWLADNQVSFVDATGNLRLLADRPGLFVERQGATRDPWPGDGTLRSLRGRGTGRAVRALVDYRPPFGVRALAVRAGVPLGTLSRTLDLLVREGLATRDVRGGVADLDWEGTLRRWAEDYDVRRSNHVATFLEPRGLTNLVDTLRVAERRYVVTGALAAQHFAPVAPARQATIYVDGIADAAEDWRLRPADAGANVVLAEPFDPVVFERAQVRDGTCVVAAPQLVVDLLTGPGREPAEAEELISVMRSDEVSWRA